MTSHCAYLKKLYTFSNCQRPISSLGVSQHLLCKKLQTYANFNLIGSRSFEIIMEENIPLSHEVVCFQMLLGTSKSNSEIKFMENYFFLKYVTSAGAVSHNVLYCQQLSINCFYQVSFYANNYFR